MPLPWVALEHDEAVQLSFSRHDNAKIRHILALHSLSVLCTFTEHIFSPYAGGLLTA